LTSITNFVEAGTLSLVPGAKTLIAWPTPDLFASTLVNQLYFGGMAITLIGWGFGLILLTNDRLIEDLAAAEQHTTELNLELRQATNQEDQPPGHSSESNRFDLAGLRVLLAEDNVFTRFALVKLLERHGMVVDAVPNGREAVSLYEQEEYGVILMDWQMPEMDGYQAARRIREVEKGLERRTPVIAIT
jgi:hypothetical protein